MIEFYLCSIMVCFLGCYFFWTNQYILVPEFYLDARDPRDFHKGSRFQTTLFKEISVLICQYFFHNSVKEASLFSA